MKRICRAMLLTLSLLLIGAAPAVAQEAIELDASVGLQGYVMPYSTSTVTVRISADVLFVGNLQVSTGGVSLLTSVEVPAGSTKVYTVDVPAISNGRANVRLFFEGEQTAVASEALNALFPGINPLVGLLGADDIDQDLVQVESVPFGRSVATLRIQPHELDRDLAPLGYLVIGPRSLDEVSADGIAAIAEWVTDGGRLIGEANDIARVDDARGETWSPTVAVAAVANGEVITVADVARVDEWSAVIRDVPPPFLGNTEFMNEAGWEVGFPMFEAASIGDGVAPGISWLFAGLLAYVLVVGPLNFFILRRVNRRELAWVTIPALSGLMLLILWIGGRSGVEGPTVTHASLVVQEEGNSRATTAMIVVAGEGGEHSLDTPAGWSVAPFDASMMFGRTSFVEAQVGSAPDGGTRLTFDMPGLGAASVNARWQPEPIPVRLAVTANDDVLDVSVTNDSDVEFWAWGVGFGSSVSAASDPLVPGSSASESVRIRQGFVGEPSIGDAVMSSLGGWDFGGDDIWQKVWPLANAVSRQETDIFNSGIYFFGYTDDLHPVVDIDDRSQSAKGPALVIIPIEPPDGLETATGFGEIVQIVGADFVDSYPGSVYAHGADAVEMRFRTAADVAGSIKVERRGGHMGGVESFEVYNWDTGQFDEFEWLGEFPVVGHVSSTGEVMVRISLESSEFNDLDLPDGAYALETVES